MAATSTNVTRVAASATSVPLLAANDRYAGTGSVSVVIVNDSTAILYVLLGDYTGAAASATNYTYQLPGNSAGASTLEVVDYRGPISGVWASATGSAQITEVL